jgi:hypothetical protein
VETSRRRPKGDLTVESRRRVTRSSSHERFAKEGECQLVVFIEKIGQKEKGWSGSPHP